MCIRMGSIADLDLDIDTLNLHGILYFVFWTYYESGFLSISLVNNKCLYGLGKVDGSSDLHR